LNIGKTTMSQSTANLAIAGTSASRTVRPGFIIIKLLSLSLTGSENMLRC